MTFGWISTQNFEHCHFEKSSNCVVFQGKLWSLYRLALDCDIKWKSAVNVTTDRDWDWHCHWHW